MSDDDKKPDDSDDDGWGEAADGAQEHLAPKADPKSFSDWQDPVKIGEKVAALRAGGKQTPASTVERREATAPTVDDGGVEPEKRAADKKDVVPEVVSTPTTAPQASAQSEGDDGMAPLASTLANSKEAAPEPSTSVDDEDAPQWSAPSPAKNPTETMAVPAPSSDMLAVADVIAKKKSDPKAKKRKEPVERNTSSGLTRKQLIRLIAGAVLLVITGVGAILGWLNSQNYYLVCGTKNIRAEQGRFWPTGQNPLPGPAFRPISVPSDALCQSTSFDSRAELELAFLDALLKQSTKLLTSGGSEQVSVAEAQLDQALLLTREPERAEQRELAERLQGDVSYWRGAAEIQRAAEVLQVGASNFEEAAGKRPRHSSDAQAWAEHARFIAEEIDKGPRSLRADEAPKEKPHFGGLTAPIVAPITPGKTQPESSGPGPEASPIDAGVPTAAPADADVPPIDAALPRGGVLL
tara:strand:- start:2281 stop:3678 length:1398 start_codon:yes stop_codon:yes gene_type:complete